MNPGHHLTHLNRVVCALAAVFLILGTQRAAGGVINFNFTVDEPCFITAGAYDASGKLVNTIWRKVRYQPGTYGDSWGGTNDSGVAVSAGTYEIRLLQNKVRYVWDGVIGNSSADGWGPTVHRGHYTMLSMAINGNNAFYCNGYNEGDRLFFKFDTADPQRVTFNFSWRLWQGFVQNTGANLQDQTWQWVATDGTRVYFACPAGFNTSSGINDGAGWVLSFQVSDTKPTPGWGTTRQADSLPTYWVNALAVGTQPGISGMAVQSNGDALAVSVAAEGKVYIINKITGQAIRQFLITNPQGLAFAPNKDLWVITDGGAAVRRYLNPEFNNLSLQASITGLSDALAVGVHPTDNNNVVVVDGGAKQQILGYNSSAQQQWTYGLLGGQPANGPTVTSNVFWFQTRNAGPSSFVTFQSDGSFWVGDAGNYRVLKFNASRALLDTIMYFDHSYLVSADPTEPSRVFNEFLEFKVDYGKPLRPNNGSWQLVKNWGAGPQVTSGMWGERPGFRGVQTVNGRTLGLVADYSIGEQRYVTELPAGNQPLVRSTTLWAKDTPSLERGGKVRHATVDSMVRVYERTITSVDANGNPQLSAPVEKASAAAGVNEPEPIWDAISPRFPVTANNTYITFNSQLFSSSTYANRKHLGGIRENNTAWTWRAAPTLFTLTGVIPLDYLGSYIDDQYTQYGGNAAMASGKHVIYGYHGEFHMNQGQANQFMHYDQDGLFLNQFGQESVSHRSSELDSRGIPGFAGNSFTPVLVSTNGELYLYHNDEWSLGVHRWHLVGADAIRTLTNSGTFGSTIALTPVPPAFPTGLSVAGADGGVQLNWNSVGGATGYKVKWSATDGGPYVTHATVTANSASIPGLTNGVLYYFVVTAMNGAAESASSAQVQARPLNPAVNVHAAGQLKDWRQGVTFKVDPLGPAANRPSLYLNYYREDLTQTGIGSRGYTIFNFFGQNSDNVNVASGFTVTKGSGWVPEYQWTQQTFEIGTQNSGGRALYADGSSGTISVLVTDTNWHYLTVFCPSRFNSERTYTVKLASQEQSSQVVTHTVDTGMRAGYSQVFQFLFRGNVTLTVEGPDDRWATVNAVFLDDAAVSLAPPPPPTPPAAPTGLAASPGNAQVSLTWNASSGATSYKVKRSTTPGSGYSVIAPSVATTSYTDTTVVNGTTYYYVVSAVNSSGESPNSNEAYATPTTGNPPAAPTGLVANYGNASVSLAWNASSGATSYKAKRSTTPGGPYSVIAPSLTFPWHTDNGVVNDTTYFYVVSAVNGFGEGADSAEANATPVAADPLLSLGKPVVVSSADPCCLGPGAVDGNINTRWSSLVGIDPGWIYIDLGNVYTIHRVKLNWEWSYAVSYKIQVSTDAVNWYDAYSTTTSSGGLQTINLVAAGRYVRMYGTQRSGPGGYSLWEFQVFGRTPVSLSQGQPATASSYDTTYVPANAVDGNLSTRWSSAMGSDPQWIYVDTGAIQSINRVRAVWEAAYATHYKIQFSSDLVNWQDMYVTTSGTGGTVDIPVFGSGRYVRMHGTQRGTPYGYSLWEFQVFR